MRIRLFIALGIGLLLGFSGAISATPPTVSARNMPDSLVIRIKPGESRSFLLANRVGTYFYGATGSGWDSGWMGLWVNRKRVMTNFSVVDSVGNQLSLEKARCEVTPFDVTWYWDRPHADLSIFFRSTESDSLYYVSMSGLRVEVQPWIQPAVFDDELGKRISAWVVSSDSRTPPPEGYLPEIIRNELSSASFYCADADYARAVAWAHIQLLFLLAEDDSLLYAGIPWFNEGWGRDTFISLPGLLVTGNTDAARKILMRYAAWVDRNPKSPTYGRVPNRVRPGEEIAYNTADGTPWWILGVYAYGLYSGDYDLWSKLVSMPNDSDVTQGAVTIALDGALSRTDSLGFLKHGDADTWMDAVGPAGPVTPRGDRAVEISALHYASLDAAIRMASIQKKKFPADVMKKWRDARDRLEKNFLAYYFDPSTNRLWDHLNAGGMPDSLARPNELFALTVPLSPLIPPMVQEKIIRRVCADIAHPYGVLSLSPTAENFHPYHQDEHYPKDDAYHNGIVWTWLSGPAKDVLTRQGRSDLTLKMAEYEAQLVLKRGCAGSLPEVTDAMPRKGAKDVALSGTVSQAWSLAEFLRTTYQDILGIRPVFVSNRVEPFWLFDPRIPESWGRVEARISLEGTPLQIAMQNYGDSTVVVIQAEQSPRTPLGIKVFDADNGITGFIRGMEPVHLSYHKSNQTAFADGTPTAKVTIRGWPYDSGPPDLTLAPPIKMRDFACLRPPDWDVLTAKEVLRNSAVSARLLVEASDPVNDDTGRCGYVYPQDASFQTGILDITRFEVREDTKSYFFTLEFANLTQPGWHPEYGFQLTFAALCLHDGTGKRYDVGANSNDVLKDPASRIIFIGGGVRIEDDGGRRLAEFIPRMTTDQFGDTATKRISFSLPKKYFPRASGSWSWSVLIGAQDDHGGAGLGEFRTVKSAVERWAGGGNLCNGPNVYDEIYVQREKP